MLFAAFFSNGQGKQKAITLTSDNVNLKAGKIHEHSASINKVKLPQTGDNKTWDYSGLSGGSAITYGYVKSKDKSFSKTAVLDTGVAEQFDSTINDTYPTNRVYDEDKNGLFFAGLSSPRTATYLQTGFIPDSLVIENQASLTSSRVNVIKFPATKNSSWGSTYSTTTKFLLTLAEIGWSNVNCTEVEYTTVKDDVAGWGDLKIPASNKGNDPNESDALMVKQSVLTTDSLFIGAVPTDAFGIAWPLGYPTSLSQAERYGPDFVAFLEANFGTAVDPYGLLLANGVTQGMPTVTDYSEIFYTENAYRPAITFDFGADNTYSTLAGIDYNLGKLGTADDEGVLVTNHNNLISNDNTNSSELSVYPNPLVNNCTLNCSMLKQSEATWTITIINMTGQVVASVPVSAKGLLNVPVELSGKTGSGLYIVNVTDEKGGRIGLSKVNVVSALN